MRSKKMILLKDDFSVSVFFGLLGKFATCTQTIHTHRYGLLERMFWKFRWNLAWKQVRKYDFLKQNNCFRINTPNLALRFPNTDTSKVKKFANKKIRSSISNVELITPWNRKQRQDFLNVRWIRLVFGWNLWILTPTAF